MSWIWLPGSSILTGTVEHIAFGAATKPVPTGHAWRSSGEHEAETDPLAGTSSEETGTLGSGREDGHEIQIISCSCVVGVASSELDENSLQI
jgi:hypothetical protein